MANTRAGRRRGTGGSKFYGKTNTRKLVRRRKEYVATYAPTNLQLDKRIQKLNRNIELKYIEQRFTLRVDNYGSPDQTSGLTLLNAVGTGTTNSTRVGNRINTTSIRFKYRLTQDQLVYATTQPPVVRVVVFWDSQPNQTYPEMFGGSNSASVFDTTLNNGSSITLAQTNNNNWKRFRILYNRTHTIYPYQYTAPSVQAPIIYVTKKIKLSRMVQYDDTVANSSAVSKNALWAYAFSDQSVTDPATSKVQILFTWRLFYKDE